MLDCNSAVTEALEKINHTSLTSQSLPDLEPGFSPRFFSSSSMDICVPIVCVCV